MSETIITGTATPAAEAQPSLPLVTPAAASTPAAAPAVPAAVAPAAAPAAVETKSAEPPKVIASLIGDKLPAEVKPADAPKPEDKPADAPIVYGELKLPEGVEVDKALMDKAMPIFTEGKVSPETAQKLVTLQGEAMKEFSQKVQQDALNHQIEVWNDYIRDQQKLVMADKELGGDKFPQAKRTIDDGLRQFFGLNDSTPDTDPKAIQHKEFIAALGYTGAGSNVHVFRTLHQLMRAYSEGGPVTGRTPTTSGKTLAEKLYGPPKAAE